MPRFNARAWHERENRRNAWMATKPATRPVQRIPVLELSAADTRKESMQLYYCGLLHDGMDENEAHDATIEHFAVADHREQESQS